MDVVLYAVFLLVNIAGIPVESALKFTEKPGAKVYHEKGSNATLVWDYSVGNKSAEFGGILWSVDDPVSSSPKTLLFEREDGSRDYHPDIPRAYIGRVHIEGRASLVIENVTSMDSTNYECTLRGKGAAIDEQNTVVLIVTVPPRAVVNPQIIAAKEIDLAIFTCTSTGVPSPNISWYRSKTPGVEIVNSSDYEVITDNSGRNSKLTIKNAPVEDIGYFVCGVSSAGFEPGLGRSFFGVPSLSSPKDSGVVRTAKVYMQELVVVECPVSGFPPPEVTWTLPNGSVLPSRLETVLSVNPTTDADLGNYTCSAESLDKTIGPFITSIQKRVSSLNFNVASGAPAVVTWNPVSNAIFYTVGVTGKKVEDYVQSGGCSLDDKDRCFMEIHFNTLPPKSKPDPVEIFVEVSALNVHIEIIARGDDPKRAMLSGAVTLQVSVMHLFVVLVLMLNR